MAFISTIGAAGAMAGFSAIWWGAPAASPGPIIASSVAPWEDTDKIVLDFAESAKEIGAIALVKGRRVKGLQNLRYTTRKRLETAN